MSLEYYMHTRIVLGTTVDCQATNTNCWMTPHKLYKGNLGFYFDICLAIVGFQSFSKAAILSLCEIPEQSCAFENVTRDSTDINYVKNQIMCKPCVCVCLCVPCLSACSAQLRCIFMVSSLAG